MVQEVQAINQALQNDDATYRLFKSIRDKDPQLAEQSYYYLEDLLVAKGEYQWCFEHMGSPQRRFDIIRHAYDMERGLSSRAVSPPSSPEGSTRIEATDPPPSPSRPAAPNADLMKRSSENRFVDHTRRLIEVLVATGHASDAETIRSQALALLDDPRLKSAIEDAQKNIHR